MEPNNILSDIASIKSLKKAWLLLNKSNKKSRGLTKVSIEDYGESDKLDKHIEKLSKDLFSGKFKFSRVRGATIAKKDYMPNMQKPVDAEAIDELAHLRPLRISEIQDRIVHKALAVKLEELLTDRFKLDNECSFAYQKNKNVEDAIIAMGRHYINGYKYILKCDIVQFFDTVDCNALVEVIKTNLPDQSVHDLLDKAINQELGNIPELIAKKVYERYFQNSELGIPQGNALSPLLANMYLSEFDQRMIGEGFKMVRYADDFIVLCMSKSDAQRAYNIACEELEKKLKLKLHPLETDGSSLGSKASRIVDPRQHKFSFLSVKFDGVAFRIDEKKIKNINAKLKCLSSIETRKQLYPQEEMGLFQALTKVKNLLEGWIAAYYYLDCDKQVEDLSKYVDVILVQIFESFHFTLKQKGLRKISVNGHQRERLALTPSQRKLSGIPDCKVTLEKARKGIASINDRIKELNVILGDSAAVSTREPRT